MVQCKYAQYFFGGDKLSKWWVSDYWGREVGKK